MKALVRRVLIVGLVGYFAIPWQANADGSAPAAYVTMVRPFIPSACPAASMLAGTSLTVRGFAAAGWVAIIRPVRADIFLPVLRRRTGRAPAAATSELFRRDGAFAVGGGV